MKILILYSGGKDSQAAMIWAVKKYGVVNCEALFCDTQWENPVTLEHIHETTKQTGVRLTVLQSEGMIELAKRKKRFPSTKARFCTEELKAKPTINYVLNHNENLIIIEGIRKNESVARSKMQAECTFFKYYFQPYQTNTMIAERYKANPPTTHNQKKQLHKALERLSLGKEDAKYYTYRKKDVVEWCKQYNSDKIRPIFNWTAQQTIDYIIAAGQTPNTLYYNGFTRVGCFPCIMARHGEVKRIIDNYPEKWNELQEAEIKLGSTFFPPDYIPSHARSDGKISTAKDVKQYLINRNATLDMFEQDTPSCMSAYNLCE